MSLRRNTVYGALGFLVPTLVVFLAYPVLLHQLGATALGIYLLAITISGSLAFLEFGVSTATVKFVAEHFGSGEHRRVAEVVDVSLVFYGALGCLGLIAFWLLAPDLARWSGAGPDLAPTAVAVLRIAALQFLPAYLFGVFGSLFKGLQRFDYVTMLNSLLSALTWGGAVLAVLGFGAGIVAVTVVTVAATVVMCALSGRLALRLCHRHGIALHSSRPTLATFRSMVRFGLFMSLNGLAGVLLFQAQLWLIAGVLTAVAVTVFSTGMQIVLKINQLMSAMFEAVMPISTTLSRGGDLASVEQLRRVYTKALVISLGLSLGASATLYLLAPSLIHLWLHSEIDNQVVTVIRVLCLGLATAGATPVVYHMLNGIGRPGINTAFMLAGTGATYGLLYAFSFGGLTVTKFALASSLAMLLNGISYFVFCEVVIWPRWLSTLRRNALASNPADRGLA